MPQGEAQPFQNVEYALVLALSEQTRHDGVSGIESNTDRYRLAMIDFVPREMFELVGRPVSEIQRARRSGLEWVAAEPDLAHVQFRAILDQAVEMPRWNIAAAYPTASSTAPPPTAITKECRSIANSENFARRRGTVSGSFLQRSPPGTGTSLPAILRCLA